jgi:hypothetical protein
MRPALPLRPVAAALAAAAAAGLWWLLGVLADDRISAVTAGAVAGGALFLCLRPLRLPQLSPAVLYLGVFSLFHLGLVVPWALGIHSGPFPPWLLTTRLTPALALVTLATGSYLAGILATARPAPAASAPACANLFLFAAGTILYVAGCGMFLAGIGSFGMARFLNAGYAGIYRLAAQFDPRLFGTSFTVTPIGLSLAAAGFPRGGLPALAGMTVLWVAGVFYLGFRGYALIPALVVLAVARERGYRLPRWAGAVLLAGVLAAIPAARAWRDAGVSQRSVSGLFDLAQPLEGIAEMGGSLRPLVHTLAYVESESWRWGRTYWQSLQTVIPNLALEWQGTPYIPLDELPPNHWLTLQAEPGMYKQHGGLGFSAVAEPYMNFGPAGVAAYFLLLGAVLGRGFRGARPTTLALWAVILGPLLWTTRNSFEIFFRPAVWGVLAVGLVHLAAALTRPAVLPAKIRYAPAARH